MCIEFFRYRVFNGQFAVRAVNGRTPGVLFEICFIDGSFNERKQVFAIGAEHGAEVF